VDECAIGEEVEKRNEIALYTVKVKMKLKKLTAKYLPYFVYFFLGGCGSRRRRSYSKKTIPRHRSGVRLLHRENTWLLQLTQKLH
jgi:hypothetical protein